MRSAFAVPGTRSAFHLRGQRNAFRSHEHQQSRSFALRDPGLRPSPSSGFVEIVCDDFPLLHATDSAAVALYAATVFLAPRRRFRLKMTCHGFPKACDHKYLFDHRLDRFDHRLDRFDHRLSKRCSALGCINTLADWSTFKSAAGTVPNSHFHSRACIKSNTHSYAAFEPDTITKPSTCRKASPTFTPPPITITSSASDSRFRCSRQRDRNARTQGRFQRVVIDSRVRPQRSCRILSPWNSIMA